MKLNFCRSTVLQSVLVRTTLMGLRLTDTRQIDKKRRERERVGEMVKDCTTIRYVSVPYNRVGADQLAERERQREFHTVPGELHGNTGIPNGQGHRHIASTCPF